MKILHVINSLSGGGAEKLVSQVISKLKDSCIDTDLLILTGTNNIYGKELEKKNVNVICLSDEGNVYAPSAIFKLTKIIGRYDIVHVHLFPSQYFVAIACMFCRNRPILITTEHSTYNKRMKYPLLKIVERKIYNKFSKIVSITEETQESLIKWLKPKTKDKFNVIENGTDVDLIKMAKALSRANINQNIAQGDFLIAMIARFEESKDQITLIRSLALLPEKYKLLLAGSGILMDDCKKLVSELGLVTRVFFLGFRKDIPALLKAVDVSVLSSHWEGFGLSSIESMAAGVPFIGSNVAGLNSIVGGAGLLFEKGDEKELATKIQELTTNADLKAKVIADQYKRVERYDIKNNVAQLSVLYKNCRNGH